MIVLSMEQAITMLIVSVFILGVVVDRTVIWFYDRYIAVDDDDQLIDADYTVS